MIPGEYLVADLVWYDLLDAVDDQASRFSTARQSAPPGWRRNEINGWITWGPRTLKLPAQGWKIHVSALPDEADDVIAEVAEYCVGHDLAFKFLRSSLVYLVRNEKYAPRASSGKLCTLYPVTEGQLELTLRELSARLAGRVGPHILSDLRWGAGPLYLRYGGFLTQYCVSQKTGDFVPAIEVPGGELVPDERTPVFRVPSWIKVPQFVAGEIRRSAEFTGKLPYKVVEALHFSNGGGVYRALDPVTGSPVVLREARPYAGLDAHGTDAVTRLARERAALERLAGSGIAPTVIEQFTCWEHHYLAEEYIEGELLQQAIGSRHPYIYADPSPGELQEFTDWALATIGSIERGLAEVHRRGLVYADLHPHNVIVRPDGQIALIDFEESFDSSEQRGSGLGAPGFVAPWPLAGTAIDDFALNCLRLAFFLPLTPICALDPGKAACLVRAAARMFPLPDHFAEGLMRGFAPPVAWDESAWRAQRPGVLRVAERHRGPEDDSGTDALDRLAWLSSMSAGIIASATPERSDRLFPGSPAQFMEGGLSVAHGAAGVLYALATTGNQVPEECVAWLVRAADEWQPTQVGLYGGLDGAAVVLALLGKADEARAVASRACDHHARMRRAGLYDGLAGAGLALLQLAALAGAPEFGTAAERIGARLMRAIREGSSADVLEPAQPGLMHGWAGVAGFFTRLHEATGNSGYLDLAETAVRRDLARCVTTKSGGLQIQDGFRVLLYLATGSSGIALVLNDLRAHRPRAEFASAVRQICRDLGAGFVVFPGLLEGRAGLLLAAAALAERGSSGEPVAWRDRLVIDDHLRRLAWHEVSYRGHPAYPGDGLLRLSMDLATGTSGVLLACHAALAPEKAVVPLIGGEVISVSN